MEKLFKTVYGHEMPDISAISMHMIDFLDKNGSSLEETLWINHTKTKKEAYLTITFFNEATEDNCCMYICNTYSKEHVNELIGIAKSFIIGEILYSDVMRIVRYC